MHHEFSSISDYFFNDLNELREKKSKEGKALSNKFFGDYTGNEDLGHLIQEGIAATKELKKLNGKTDKIVAESLQQSQLLGIEAAKQLAEDNIGLAINLAVREVSIGGLSFNNAIAVACYALVRAAHKYNPKKGKFSTYATVYITNELKRARNSHLIKLPSRYFENLSKILKIIDDLIAQTNDTPTKEEAAKSILQFLITADLNNDHSDLIEDEEIESDGNYSKQEDEDADINSGEKPDIARAIVDWLDGTYVTIINSDYQGDAEPQDIFEVLPVDSIDPLDRAMRSSLYDRLMYHINQLAPEYRAIFLLKVFLEDGSNSDTHVALQLAKYGYTGYKGDPLSRQTIRNRLAKINQTIIPKLREDILNDPALGAFRYEIELFIQNKLALSLDLA